MDDRQTNGMLVGIVSDLNDPERLGRVKVKFPTLDYQESDWVRLATPMAGANRGVFFRPEKDDEVLIGFECGDPRRPYMLGALWSTADKPPPDDGQPTSNNWRFIQSRSGHIIKLDDTRGGEKIEVIDKDGLRRVVIDSANSKVQVTCRQGDVEVEAAAGSVTLKALTITVEATNNLTLKCNAGPVTIQGSVVNINP